MINWTLSVIDDDIAIRDSLAMALAEKYDVATYENAEEALSAMSHRLPDLVLLDIGLPGMSGLEALGHIKAMHPSPTVIMVTAFEDIDSVIAAMKNGAYDYVVKPIHLDGLEIAIQNALETLKLRKEVQNLQHRLLEENLPCFIGESHAIQNVLEFMETVAQSPDTPIMIIGETGTGKELVAKAVHYQSPNCSGPLVTVNCATLPKDLVESELFGYEKGAFSGARESGKKGIVEEAHNGTLFLDEIGDLSLEAQAKLLRFLETGEYLKVGGTKTKRVTTRVISATNKDVTDIIQKGLFRKDLFFRLSVIRITVPSLNERPEDILPLAKHFLYEFSQKFLKPVSGISAPAQAALMAHHWTGNVRELKSLIERAVLVSKAPEISIADLGVSRCSPRDSNTDAPPFGYPPLPATGIDLPAVERALEKHYIEQALTLAKGNETQAARLLNINHHTFRYRRKRTPAK